jgi:hypothetical protein
LTDKGEKTYAYKVLEKTAEKGLVEFTAADIRLESNNLPNRLLGETIALDGLGPVLRDIAS